MNWVCTMFFFIIVECFQKLADKEGSDTVSGMTFDEVSSNLNSSTQIYLIHKRCVPLDSINRYVVNRM